MNILEAMEKSRVTGKCITNNHYKMNMKYLSDFHCMVWTYKDGSTVQYSADPSGVKRVILSPKLSEYEWELVES